MKITKKIWLLGLLTLVMLGSCSKEEDKVDPPVAGFTSNKTTVFVDEEVTFTNTSSDAVSYVWSFGDGTTSTLISPTKAYSTSGVFTVTLAATGEGGTDSYTMDITVEEEAFSSVYFIDSSDELIQSVILDGSGTLTTIKDVAGMSGVGLTYYETNDQIFFSDFFDAATPDGKIWKMNLDGTGAEAIASGIFDPYGIDIDEINEKIYWADDAGNISRANLDGTENEVIIYTELADLSTGYMRAVTVDPENNKIYYYEVWEEDLWVADLDGSNPSKLISGVYGYAIFVDTVNDKIYFNDQNSPGLLRANLDGTLIETVDDTDTRIYGIDIDYDENKLYWSGRDSGEISKADLDGANKETVVSGLSSPRGIFFKK